MKNILRTILAATLVLASSLAGAQPKGARVTVNGMQMYYEVSGKGEPLVVLHGAYMNIPTMGAIVGKLAETHKVYALEFQGHGRTTESTGPSPIPAWRTMWRSSWTRSASRRPTCSAIPWAPSPGCSSPSATRKR